MRHFSFVLLIIAGFYTHAYAQDSDHLWPEASHYSNAVLLPDEYVFQRFEEAFDPHIRARVLVYPSGQPEYAIAIRENIEIAPVSITEQAPPYNPTYDLLYLKFEHSLSDFEHLEELERGAIKVLREDGSEEIDRQAIIELKTKLPASRDEVGLYRCEKKIEPDFAKAILNVWKKALLQTRYSEKQPRKLHRGYTYHFAFNEDYFDPFGYPTNYAGYAQGPVAGTKIRQLVYISELLREFCSEQNYTESSKILNEARKLDERLNGNYYKESGDTLDGH
ncbi:MAG: hypothetical protein DHS20C05_08860 [Hyphococcus sp.]|nr:MAG: hypothetical protein DHS20C05_08860 [Marinicaulis sp.]